VKPQNTDHRVYQLLGLAWAGESAQKLQPLAKALMAEQQADGGWAQLRGMKSDAFATGQAVYALRVAAGRGMVKTVPSSVAAGSCSKRNLMMAPGMCIAGHFIPTDDE